MEDCCIMCGEIIPEGRMVCPACEAAVLRGEIPRPQKEVQP